MPRVAQGSLPPIASQQLGVTALAGGALSGSPVMSAGFNEVSTVASGSDSVQLPPAVFGLEIFIYNAAAANAVLVYANGSDTINATAGATGITQAAAKGALYVCHKTGVWSRILTG